MKQSIDLKKCNCYPPLQPPHKQPHQATTHDNIQIFLKTGPFTCILRQNDNFMKNTKIINLYIQISIRIWNRYF